MAETYEGMTRRLAVAGAANRIREELVCCDIYAKVNDSEEMSFEEAVASKEWHDLCYWGEASARIAEKSWVAENAEPSGRGRIDFSQRVVGLSIDDQELERKIMESQDRLEKAPKTGSARKSIDVAAHLLGLRTGRHRRD